jgi:flavin reductase (DIM6/NTAB) family NADH-FMN oxidoreductase RutF
METIDKLFKTIAVTEITDNFFKVINDDWLLITAGTPDKFNTMTASWGAVGVLWHKPVGICFIRSTRHTLGFVNDNNHFTLSFFTEKERSILQYCGAKSGRDVDKIAKTGLVPLKTNSDAIIFQQARLCLECRKIYYDDLKPSNFVLPETDRKIYPLKDYHRMFIGDIITVYSKK